MTTVSVFGGTGFLGRRLVQRLAAGGTTVRAAVRLPYRARRALRATGLDRVTVFGADVRDQSGFVLVSGIGGDPESGSPYIRARGRGERAVEHAFPGATIVRPSAMFGPGDALFGTLAHLARLLPVLPLIGDGHARLQPVYVEDVAEGVARISPTPGTAGRTYELAGPTVYTLRELFSIALRIMGKRRLIVPVPFAVAQVQARLFEMLPNPPLTTGQVDLLKADNVASGTLPGLHELNIQPKPIEDIVPTYLGRSRVGA